ncbi:MAG: trigger factor [Zetaproteobacteria bacterium]|nr:trigger factor [Zetaproteobacteria bacterium]
MIQTNVKQLSDHEHQVHVTLPQSEYDRVYAEQTSKLSAQAKLPGFRPGKIPKGVIQKQFGVKIHEDTVSELLQANYVGAIESSGLVPAVQPELTLPSVQPAAEFNFTLNVVTWPKVELSPLADMTLKTTKVSVEDDDIKAVVQRLMTSQVKYEIEDQRTAENGDQVTMDFVGFVGDEAFDGGDGEDHALVLGSGQFIPGFEDQLIGHQAGEHVVVTVTFPDPYQAEHLAGKEARFETDIKSVAKAVTPSDEDALASMLNFEDAAALREDALQRLSLEAEQASYQSSHDAVLEALLEANLMTLPARLVDEEMKSTMQRITQNMKQQGVDMTDDMLTDEAFLSEVRERSERNLKSSILIQTVRKEANIELDEGKVDAELEQLSKQYPADQHDAFVDWMKSQDTEMAGLRDGLLEKECISYVLQTSNVEESAKALSVWQQEQDAQK